MLVTDIATLDELLNANAGALGDDFTLYRNHTYRVVNLCIVQGANDPVQLEKVAIAAAFHDLGIWTDRTFDYLPPSIRLASAYLASSDRADWTAEVTAMILQHHKIRAYRGNWNELAEPFRRADWADVTRGVISYGLSRRLIGDLFARWPSAGFHRKLALLELNRLRTHPWSPLPMLKL